MFNPAETIQIKISNASCEFLEWANEKDTVFPNMKALNGDNTA